MITLDRRGWLAGAATALLAPRAAETQVRPRSQAMYDYLFLDLDGGPPGPALAAKLKALPIAAGGGDVLGLFTPQLGWRARQAAVLLRWSEAASGREAVVASLGGERDRLTPTARPSPTDRPASGGIYVHRWFVIDTPALDEFVALSTEGWKDFETRFDTNIFGLFTAEPTAAERTAGRMRLLLVTRYASHGVWEASRDPSTAAMAAFARRQKLTRDTWAASTLLASA
ncbi:MAG: hypothetical protein AB1942_18180 [Pseudomonadota bacterium]